jgi:hypothetical protein
MSLDIVDAAHIFILLTDPLMSCILLKGKLANIYFFDLFSACQGYKLASISSNSLGGLPESKTFLNFSVINFDDFKDFMSHWVQFLNGHQISSFDARCRSICMVCLVIYKKGYV